MHRYDVQIGFTMQNINFVYRTDSIMGQSDMTALLAQLTSRLSNVYVNNYAVTGFTCNNTDSTGFFIIYAKFYISAVYMASVEARDYMSALNKSADTIYSLFKNVLGGLESDYGVLDFKDFNAIVVEDGNKRVLSGTDVSNTMCYRVLESMKKILKAEQGRNSQITRRDIKAWLSRTEAYKYLNQGEQAQLLSGI